MCKTGYGSDRRWICKGRASKAGDGFANWADGGVGVEFEKREGCRGPWLRGRFGVGFRGSRSAGRLVGAGVELLLEAWFLPGAVARRRWEAWSGKHWPLGGRVGLRTFGLGALRKRDGWCVTKTGGTAGFGRGIEKRKAAPEGHRGQPKFRRPCVGRGEGNAGW